MAAKITRTDHLKGKDKAEMLKEVGGELAEAFAWAAPTWLFVSLMLAVVLR